MLPAPIHPATVQTRTAKVPPERECRRRGYTVTRPTSPPLDLTETLKDLFSDSTNALLSHHQSPVESVAKRDSECLRLHSSGTEGGGTTGINEREHRTTIWQRRSPVQTQSCNTAPAGPGRRTADDSARRDSFAGGRLVHGREKFCPAAIGPSWSARKAAQTARLKVHPQSRRQGLFRIPRIGRESTASGPPQQGTLSALDARTSTASATPPARPYGSTHYLAGAGVPARSVSESWDCWSRLTPKPSRRDGLGDACRLVVGY